ncbi:hypothetical protein E5161_02120 [Cohnella pontilimi]|uniref:Uncharacterized protein n=1 Tax=Cohnella pontilimi TaxID=2564100 RepID=A0A4U0FKW8_9BACL|nr:hypothetical protein [Cohnella pontilimi]TJY44212.1 hypothetical protein E5161_02120 [Cohnella pontilimi]
MTTQGEGGMETEFPLSIRHLRFVPQDLLDARIVPVKGLRQEENETYRLVKDSLTGEHYLHYGVRHVNLAAGGAEEEFHHLMPVEHDDVISYALGAQDFHYPENWKKAYLRNGPAGGFVWYDPNGAVDRSAEYDAIAAQIREKLHTFRREGRSGTEEMQKLIDDMERLFRPETNKDPSSE